MIVEALRCSFRWEEVYIHGEEAAWYESNLSLFYWVV